MLEITGDDVARLDDEDLRLLIAKLCAAELRRAGCKLSSLLDGGHQLAPDGGVDVRVDLSIASSRLDFIPRHATVFQSKAEDMPPKKIKIEMGVGGRLRPAIRQVLQAGGAYIIVSSKGTVSDINLQARRDAMKQAAGRLKPGGHVDFYDRKRLARWIREYPGVELWLRSRIGKPLGGWQAYGDWSGVGAMELYLHDDATRIAYRGGQKREPLSVQDGASRLRQLLEQPGHVARLIGLAGTGKTRFVQALFEPGLGAEEPLDPAHALYTDLGREPNPNARDMILQLIAMEQRAIVIVDNCNPATHAALASIIREHSTQISLLTVEYDVSQDDEPEATEVFELASAPAGIVEALLVARFPRLSDRDRRAIGEFSGGNARIALALARTGRNQGSLSNGELFKRLFYQGHTDGADLMRAAEVCSLVYSFDATDTDRDDSELARLARLAGSTVPELYRRVAMLKRRDLIQSRSRWRAVLPPALSNRLAKQALQNLPSQQLNSELRSHIRLLKSFSRRLSYLHDSAEAHAFACEWLRDTTWLAQPARLDDLGRLLLGRVAPLAQEEVLVLIEHALDLERLGSFVDGQRGNLDEWMTLLRQLSYEPARFDRAARLMLRLAATSREGEGKLHEPWTETFRIALSGTLAPPSQRAAFLMHALQSPSSAERSLAIDAITASLETVHLASSHDFDFGAHARSYGWEASSLEEFLEWFRISFAMLRTLAAADREYRTRARLAISTHFRTLWYSTVLHENLQLLVTDLCQSGAWPEMWSAIKSVIRFDGAQMAAPSRDRLTALLTLTVPQTLAERIQLYVLPAQGYVDLLDAVESDDAPDDGLGALQKLDRLALELGKEAAGDEVALASVLPGLVAPSPGFGRYAPFGQGLAEASGHPRQRWEQLRDAYAGQSEAAIPLLLCGFLQGLRRTQPALADEIIDASIGDRLLGRYFPQLLCPTVNDRDGDRLIQSMRGGLVPAFKFGLRLGDGVRTGLSATKFCDVLAELASMRDGLAAALDTLGQVLFDYGKRIEEIPTELLEAGRRLLEGFQFQKSNDSLPHRVNEIAKICLQGERGRKAANSLASQLAAALSEQRLRGDGYAKVACTLLKIHPEDTLSQLIRTTGTPLELPISYAYSKKRKSVVNCTPRAALLRWIAVDPDQRAPAIAREIEILAENGAPALSALALELLSMTPNRSAVLQGFTKRFYPSVWTGSISEVLRPFQDLLSALLDYPEDDVAEWARVQLGVFARRIESDRRFETSREESFE